ncbi:hypothetical protein IEE94_08130 [Yimella sp. cx-573]|nr:hypothetical protein [Yimella sp. cx-573]
MSQNPLPVVTAVDVLTPDAYTTVLAVRFAGMTVTEHYGFTAAMPGKRRLAQFFQPKAASLLMVSVPVHATLRQQSYSLAGRLRTADGEQVVRDLVFALQRLNGSRVMQISGYLAGNSRPSSRPPSRPAPVNRPPARTPREHAVMLLVRNDREDDAALVDQVVARFDSLSVREQEAVRQAIRAIIEAFTLLGRLTSPAQVHPGPDGSTPQEDAHSAVDAALSRLSVALNEAQRGDADGLRALRRYAGQWAERPDDPLSLG